jgi:hypothetical protein
MREITSHVVNPANDQLKITVEDRPGSGGASHLYMVRGFSTKTNPSFPLMERRGSPAEHATILFQNGPIAEAGVNGVTHEALIAIVMDRLESFQDGPYASQDNAEALDHLGRARACLERRTRERMARGVEGTHTV